MLNISGQNIDLTDAIKNQVEKKYNKLKNRFPINNLNFNFSVAKKQFRCHVDATSTLGNFSANDSGEDFHYALNQSFLKLERQLHDEKDRHIVKSGDSIRYLEELTETE